jgi:hypothetical protein
MAVICGEDGNVTFSDLVINCYAWSLDIEADMFPATKFGDNRFKSSVAGMLQWSGNLSWRMDSAAAADWAGNRGALVLTADTQVTYSGDAWLAANHLTLEKEGEALGVIDFTGDGALTVAPTVTPSIGYENP